MDKYDIVRAMSFDDVRSHVLEECDYDSKLALRKELLKLIDNHSSLRLLIDLAAETDKWRVTELLKQHFFYYWYEVDCQSMKESKKDSNLWNPQELRDCFRQSDFT